MALYRNIGNVEQPKTGFDDHVLVNVYTDFGDTGWNIPRPKYPADISVYVEDPPYPADDTGRQYDMMYPVPDERPMTPPAGVVNTAIVETPEGQPAVNTAGVLTLGALVVSAVSGQSNTLIFGGLLALLAYRLNNK